MTPSNPAFFIAGGIGVFISQASVMKYLGAGANKVLAYGVASVSGTVLAVCSCTVLPLFAGIYRMGAGIGPASAFLYAGPAVNVLAIVLTARVLGAELGIARAVAADEGDGLTQVGMAVGTPWYMSPEQIQGEQVRVSGKKRDDLQQVIAFLKSADIEMPLQFVDVRAQQGDLYFRRSGIGLAGAELLDNLLFPFFRNRHLLP